MKRILLICGFTLLLSPGAYAGPADRAAAWLFGKLDESLPGSLTYDKLDASFSGPIIVENLSYRDGETEVSVRRAELDWSLSAMLRLTAKIELFEAQDVTIRLPAIVPGEDPQPQSDEPLQLPDIELPVDIEIDKLDIRNARIHYPASDTDPYVIDQLALSLKTEDNTLYLNDFTFRALQAQMQLKGQLTPSGDYPLQLTLDWNYQGEDFGPLQGSAALQGAIGGELRHTQRVSGTLNATGQATLRQVLSDPSWQGALELAIPDLGVFSPELAGHTLSSELQSQGNPRDYSATGRIDTTALPQVGAVEGRFAMNGGSEGLRIQTLSLNASDSPLTLDIQGTVDLAARQLDLKGQWRDLAWPLTGTPQFALPQGQFALQGSFTDYDFSFDTTVRGAGFGSLNVRVEASGDERALQISQAVMQTADSDFVLNLGGDLVFADQRFDIRGAWQNFAWPLVGEPQIRSPRGEFNAQGTPSQYTAQLDALLASDVAGDINAALRIAGDAQSVQLQKIALSAPNAELNLTAQGFYNFFEQRFEASGQWQALTWPLVGEPQIRSPRGEFNAQGRLPDFNATLSAAVQAEDADLAARAEIVGDAQTVRIQTLRLSDPQSGLDLTIQGDYALADQRFDIRGAWQALVWPLSGEPQIEVPSGEFSAQGTPQDYRLQLDTVVQTPASGRLDIQLSGQGNEQTLERAELVVRAPERDLELRAQGRLGFADLSFQADGRWRNLAFPLVGEPQVESPSGEFSASGDPGDYRARIDAVLLGPDRQNLDARIQASGSDQQVRIEQIALQSSEGGPSLSAQGSVNLLDLSFQADGAWQNLVWPLSGEPQIEAVQGAFEAKGKPSDYRFSLDTQVRGPGIPAGRWRLQGEGNDRELERVTLSGEVLEGTLTADLNLRWQPLLSWRGSIAARGINPGGFVPTLPGEINLQGRSNGELRGDGAGLLATVELEELSGQLRGQVLQGQGRIAIDGDTVAIDEFTLRAGEAVARVDGTLAERWDLRWQLQVPELTRLVPGASGRLNSSGVLSGTAEQPQAEFSLDAERIDLAGTRIRQLRGQGRIDLSGASESSLTLTGADIELAGQTWQRLDVEGSGTPEQHRLSAALDGPAGRYEAALQGSWREPVWQGQLSRLTARDTAAGTWALDKPAALRASGEQARLDSACLKNPPSQLCVSAAWDARQGAQVEVAISQLTAAPFAQYLPENLEVNTRLSGDIALQVLPSGSLQGRVELNLSPGDISMAVSGNPLSVPIASGSLTAELAGGGAAAKLAMDFERYGRIEASASVADVLGAGRLSGAAEVRLDDLSLVAALVPQLSDAQGRLSADVGFGGTLADPNIDLDAQLSDARADIPQVNCNIRELQITARGDLDGPFSITGSARSGPGRIDISGQIGAGGAFAVAIKGRDFLVSDTEDIRVLANPDLRISLAEGRLRVEGEILIPEASLSPPESRQAAITASEDVVVVRDTQGQRVEGEDSPLDIFVDVQVVLGDEVRVKAFDLDAKLDGSLRVEQSPTLAPRGTGRIRIESGEYRIYGQDLTIERGNLLFSGSSLDNPGLDLRVVRRVDDVAAGAQITGTAKDPRLELFSVPPLPDSAVLSYIAFGRAPNSVSGSEQAMLLGAAAGLLTRKLQPQLGLDEFSVESDGGGSSLFIGKYLTPDLFISYGIGLFEATNTLKLRYRLTDHLRLESTTNAEGSGADLIYTFER